MFFHVLSFYFSLLGAQNMIFLGLNFVTISLDNSSKKKSIFRPVSGGGTPFDPLFLFFLLFFSPVFFFFVFFLFVIFSFFLKKKSFFFSFFLYFFQKYYIACIIIGV